MKCWKLTVTITIGVLLTVGASPFVNYQLEGKWTNEEIATARKSSQSYIMLNQEENPESDKENSGPRMIIRVNTDSETERSSLPPLDQHLQPSDLSMEDRENIALNFLATYEYVASEEKRVSKSELVKKMQKNYGIKESGNLDDETMTLMMSPRCGVPDEPADYTFFSGRPKWKSATVTYRVVGYSPDISPCQTRNALKRAFRIWEEQVELTFVEKKSPNEKVDMEILFAYRNHRIDTYDFDGEGKVLAHAFAPSSYGTGGDTHFDESEYWTLGKGQVADTYNGNANGSPCRFPFIYQGKSHFSCITNDQGLDWCATTDDFDQDGKFGFCPHEKLLTYGGNGDRKPCVFPFTSDGKTYTKCTSDGRDDGYKWCATTSNFDQDKKFGFCPDRIDATKGGNSDGAPCVFPFTVNGQTYTGCTWHYRYRDWCATTSNYEQDGKWGYCKGKGTSLYIVAAHEFGHALGMKHSKYRALMFPTYNYVDNLKLSDDDIRGIRNLYGGPRRSALPPLKLEQCGGQIGGSPTNTRPTTAPTTTTITTTTTIAPTTTTTTTRPTTMTTTTLKPVEKKKLLCKLGYFDASLMLLFSTYYFKGQFMYDAVKDESNSDVEGMRIVDKFTKGPRKVDAAFMMADYTIMLFKGKKYWQYSSYGVPEKVARPVKEIGLITNDIIKAIVPINENQILIFYENYFVSYNPKTRKQGIKKFTTTAEFSPPDGAIGGDIFTNKDVLHFFKGKNAYQAKVVTSEQGDVSLKVEKILNLKSYLKC